MAGGKRGPSKKQQITAKTANLKGRLQQPFEKHSPEKSQANGPAARKRQHQIESDHEELGLSPKSKRARVSPTTRQSKAGTTTFARDSVGQPRQVPTKDLLLKQQYRPLLPPTKPNDKPVVDSKNGTILRDDTVLQDLAHAPTPSTPHGKTVSPVKDINSPDPNLWIPFGRLCQLGHPRVFWEFKMENNGRTSESIRMGSDRKEAKILVFGCGVGGDHCLLTLELGVRHDGSLRRRVVVQTTRTPEGTPSLLTGISVGDKEFQVEDKMVLPPGAILQLGDGERYMYDGPEFATLYSRQGEELHGFGRKDVNSSVVRVQRLSDKRPFVAKVIAGSHIHMANTELQVFKKLGRHPRIVQLIEVFYDPKSRTHHLVLEAGFKDLERYIAEMRPHSQDVLRINAPQWVHEITSGIQHIHDHGITHRDIKPKNIVAFVSAFGRVEMKIIDMGLARRHTGSVTKQASMQFSWRAGSPYWFAPASFMAPYQDAKLVDCYGVGRVLFALLTPDLWPEESEDPQKVCGCTQECRGPCAKRQTAFRVIEDTGVGDECLDFLKHLLVEVPEKCNNASQMLKHPYMTEGVASQEWFRRAIYLLV